MNDRHLDRLAKMLATTSPRRAALRSLVGGAGAALLSRLGLEKAEAACKNVGKSCAKDGDCCHGAHCKRGRCKCKPGWQRCDNLCCLPGQICLLALGVPICLGPKQPGDSCDPSTPGECSSGTCGCDFVDGCGCRIAACHAAGELCGATFECCTGLCGSGVCLAL